MHRPSIRNGFAPRDGTPRHPSLWRGCVAALAPGLGPTGVILRDWAPRHNHATITNMSMASGWTVNGSTWGLTFDGVNDFASMSLPIGGLMRIGISIWFNWTTYANDNDFLMEYTPNINAGGNRGFFINPNDSSGQFVLTMSAGSAPYNGCSFARPAAGWRHLAVNMDRTIGTANNFTVWVDGVRISTTQVLTGDLSATSFASSSLFFASRNGTSLWGATAIDDFRVYDRLLTNWDAALLARRRCIAYELDDEAFGYYSAPSGGAARLRRILAGLP